MSRELVAYMKLFHGAYNSAVLLLFLYQGSLGFRIRRSDRQETHIIRRHRKIGPIAAVLGIAGFCAGTIVAYLDAGRILLYPLHFIAGAVIVSLIITTSLISQRIKVGESYWRDRHYYLGLVIISLYCVQALLGLGILL